MNEKDLVVLAADHNIEQALIGLFTRPEALGIRAIDVNISVHPQHDPGCALHGVELLSNLSKLYRYGLLIFDREGSGIEQKQPQEMQTELNREFEDSAWGKRARARWPRLGAAADGEEAMKLSELSGVPPSFQFEEFLVGF